VRGVVGSWDEEQSQSRTARADVDECYLLVSRVHSHGTVVNPAGDAVLTAPIVKEGRSEALSSLAIAHARISEGQGHTKGRSRTSSHLAEA
jgi:hypothetical protein